MNSRNCRKLCVFFPGIGYTVDKPLLYYSRGAAAAHGYEMVCIGYHDLPQKVRGDKEKLMQSIKIAFSQTCEVLEKTDFASYDEIVFAAKSIGTVVAAMYAEKYVPNARMILYTPVEVTFESSFKDAVAFIGDSDPWSDYATVKAMSEARNVPLYTFKGCNHSLETGGPVSENIEILREVMKLTEDFLN